MSDRMDFPVNKMDDPIEVLSINRRAYHTLKRGNVETIADILHTGEQNLSKIRNMGPLQLENVFLAVANYLGMQREYLCDRKFIQTGLTYEKKPTDPLRTSITVLNLSEKMIKDLQSVRIIQVDDLIKSRFNQYKNIARFGDRFITKVDRELHIYLENKVKGSEHKIVGLVNAEPEIQPKLDLGEALVSIKILERTWMAIELRAGQLNTLEEVASKIGGFTRERARQIIEQAYGRVNKNLGVLGEFLDYFEMRARKIQDKLSKDSPLKYETLISALKKDILDSMIIATDNDIKKLILLVRMMIIHRKSASQDPFSTLWESFTFLCCLVEPPIEKHDKVNSLLDEQKRIPRKLHYKELAYLILQEQQKAMHWTEITDKAYKLNNRENFDSRGIYNALQRHEELFVRVGQGTYELAEWGSKVVDAYPDILASILKLEKHTLSLDTILAKVSAVRAIKQSSLVMYLELHPRFYKSINGMYGLRGWLPPREKQTLRTPGWLVEDPKSLERVERSENRGYDIDNLIEGDKLMDE